VVGVSAPNAKKAVAKRAIDNHGFDSHCICGSNHISGGPRRFNAALYYGQFVVRYLGAAALGIVPTYPVRFPGKSPASVLQQSRFELIFGKKLVLASICLLTVCQLSECRNASGVTGWVGSQKGRSGE
jgi:hypothetical protein